MKPEIIEQEAEYVKFKAHCSNKYTDAELKIYNQAVVDVLKRIKSVISWDNPYMAAIALLEQAARSHEGSYG